RARPIVLPVFVQGLSNVLPREVRGNFDGTGAPITMVFGRPMDFHSICADEASPQTWRRIADQVRNELAALGSVERALRSRLGLPPIHPLPASKGGHERASV